MLISTCTGNKFQQSSLTIAILNLEIHSSEESENKLTLINDPLITFKSQQVRQVEKAIIKYISSSDLYPPFFEGQS